MSQSGRSFIGTDNPIDTLTGNTGGPVGPTAGNINIVGTGVISVAGNPATSTLTISSSAISGITITGDTGGALGPSNAFTFTGGTTGLVFNGAGTTETLGGTLVVSNGGTGKASFTAYSVICGGTTSTGALQNVSGVGTSGQILTSNGAGALPTWQAAPASGIQTINGDTGSVTGSTVTFNANSQAGSSVKFTGSVATMSFNVTDTLDNTLIGKTAGNGTLSGQFNTMIGENVGHSLTTGNENSGIGYGAMAGITTSATNIAVGYTALNALTTGNGGNVALGSGALNLLTTGARNVCVGVAAGNSYTTSESDNILLNNVGTIGESNTLRIGGGTGTGSRQLAKAFISGIDGVNVGSVARVVTEASDQLGTAIITAGTGISVTAGANTITIAASGTSTLTYTSVNHAASPYTVLSTDEYIGADVTAGVISILLPNAPSTGRTYTVKDKAGLAATSNITVTTVGGVVTIDGSTSFVMNTAYESANFMFNGTSYEVW